MTNWFFFYFLVLCLSYPVLGDSITEKCEALSNNEQVCNKPHNSFPTNLNAKSTDLFMRWSWFYDKAHARKNILEAEFNNSASLYRYLRDGFVESDESRSWYEEKFSKIQIDFENLRILVKEIEKASYQLNQCFRLCGPSGRREKEETLNKLQQLKMVLLAKSPILASSDIEEIVSSDNVKEDGFKNALINSYRTYLRELKAQVKSIQLQFDEEERQLNFARSSPTKATKKREDYFFSLIEDSKGINDLKSELISQIDWTLEFSTSSNVELSCKLYLENLDYIKSQETKALVTDIGLVALPLIAGPAFRLGAIGLRASGLAKWGMRDELYASISKSLTGTISSGFFLGELYKISINKNQCSRSLSDFIQNGRDVDYQKYTECNDAVSDSVLMLAAESAFTSVSSVHGALKSFKISNSFDKGKTLFNVKNADEFNYYLETKSLDSETFGDAGIKLSTEKGDYFVLNLNGPQDEVKIIGENYWEYVSKTYKKRLNLSDKEIDSFIESSNKMSVRTTLLVSTPHGKKNIFRGGVALVTSKNSNELMPFEKATGIRVKRGPGESTAEIVRLTVDEKIGDKRLSDELVSQVLATIKARPGMKKVYVYTSKSHQRLYQRMLKKQKIHSEVLHDLERDVVLEIDVETFLN